MAWNPIDQPVDYIVLAGQKSPGLAEVIGAEAAREYAVRQPPFSTGSLIVYKRIKLAEFSVKIRLYTTEDFAAWDAWRPIVDRVPATRRRAQSLDITHPLLDTLGIKKVVVKAVSQLEQEDEGVWVATIKFLQDLGLPKQTLAKVEGSKAAPVDPYDQAILTNDAAIKRLAAELAK